MKHNLVFEGKKYHSGLIDLKHVWPKSVDNLSPLYVSFY